MPPDRSTPDDASAAQTEVAERLESSHATRLGAGSVALEAEDVWVRVDGSRVGPLNLNAAAGTVTLWPAGDDPGAAEFALALAGRYALSEGVITVASSQAGSDGVRRSVALARVADVVEPEHWLKAAEYVRLAYALAGSRAGRLSPDDALELVGLESASHVERIERMTAADRVRVAVAGALLGEATVVVVDRMDRGVVSPDWEHLLADMRAAAHSTGVAIIGGSSRFGAGGSPA